MLIKIVNISAVDNMRNPTGSESESRVNALAASIKSNGMLCPVVVARDAEDTSKYHLIDGFGRLAAVRALGGETIEAVDSGDVRDIAMQRAIANVVRRDVTPYEIAQWCHHLHTEKGFSLKLIATRLKSGGATSGCSESNISNLVSSFSKLPPIALEDWRDGKAHATLEALFRVKGLKEELRSVAWQNVRLAANGTEGAEGEGAEKGEKVPGKPNAKEIQKAIESLNQLGAVGEYGAALLAWATTKGSPSWEEVEGTFDAMSQAL